MFNDCKDHRNKKEVPDPIVKDLISDKIRKRNKSKADDDMNDTVTSSSAQCCIIRMDIFSDQDLFIQ